MIKDTDDFDVFIRDGKIRLTVTDDYGCAECKLSAEEARRAAAVLIAAADQLEIETK